MLAAPARADVVDHGFEPRTWQDARDDGGAGLDLRRVSFGQRDTQLWLRLRTEDTWAAGTLEEDLCLVLGRRRLCVGGDGSGAPVLRLDGRPIRAVVTRPDERSLFARFHRLAVRLPFGRLRWAVESGADRAPARGWYAARVDALGQPPCFGAAARAAAAPASTRPCAGASSRARAPRSSRPTCPAARSARACRVVEPCAFGYRGARTPRVALIGDSHAAHLRATVEVVAQARGWPAISMTHNGCAFSTEVYTGAGGIPATCRRHTSEALRWLRSHPSVHTVFTSASAGRGFGAGGFLTAFRQAPRSVRRIYVIRDVPRVRFSTASCVLSVLRRGLASGRACALPRGAAILGDPAADAARSAGGRVRLIDLNRHFCDAARCYPVVGGAYVYKDDNHLNSVFATTLGPFVLRRAARMPRRDALRPRAHRVRR